MRLSVLVFTLLVFYGLASGDNNKMKRSKNKLKIIGYTKELLLNRVKNVQVLGYLLTPIVISPEVKISIPNFDNIKETNELKMNASELNSDIVVNTTLNKDNNDIEINFRQALNRGSAARKELRETKVNETQDLVVDATTSGTTATDIISEKQNNTSENSVVTTTEFIKIYPAATYNNTEIESLVITNKEPDTTLLPPKTSESWKNFTSTTSNEALEDSKEFLSNITAVTEYPSVNEIDSTIKGVYPAAVYHNAEIDQLSITTNSHTNELPLPSHDDRWSFSSLRKIPPNQFKPLAGLYYDGFLHKPLPKIPGFVPYNRYNYS